MRRRFFCAIFLLSAVSILAQDSYALVIDDFTDGALQAGPGEILTDFVQEGLSESSVIGGRRLIRNWTRNEMSVEVDASDGGSFSYANAANTSNNIALYYGNFDATETSPGLDLTVDGADTLAVEIERVQVTRILPIGFEGLVANLGLVSGAILPNGGVGGLSQVPFLLPNSEESSTITVSFEELASEVDLTDVDRLYFDISTNGPVVSAELEISRIYTFKSVPEPSTAALVLVACTIGPFRKRRSRI